MNRKKKSTSTRIWLVAGAVVVLTGAAIALGTLGNRPEQSGTASTPPVKSAEASNVRGSASAKVTLIEYGDYK